MRETKTLDSKVPSKVWELLSVFALDIIVYGGLFIILPLWFMLFDAFHITQTWLQVIVFVSPLLMLALVLWWRERRKKV
jgi:hypothetical protein